jgi:cell division transport system permease protein
MATAKRKISRSVGISYAASTISMTFVLFLLGTIGFVMANIYTTANRMRESVVMIVELKDGLSESERNEIGNQIGNRDMVVSMKYLSKEDKADDEEFKRLYAIDVQGVLGVNPLPDSFDVTLSELSADKAALEQFVEEVRQIKGVTYVNYPQTFIEQMHSTLDILQLVLAIFGGALLVVAFVLLNNTIRLMVYARRELINTLKAVGATKWFIMRPFVGRSALQGLFSGLLAVALLVAALYGLNHIAPGFGLLPRWEELAVLGGAMVVLGIIVAVVCTLPIVNRFVNMNLFNFKEFVLIGVHACCGQLCGGVKMNYLSAVAGGRIEFSEVVVFACNRTRFFLKLSFACLKRILALFKFACRKLKHNLHVGISELPYEYQFFIIGKRRNAYSAVMLNNFTGAGSAVMKFRFVTADIDYSSFIYIILFNGLFKNFHNKISPCI